MVEIWFPETKDVVKCASLPVRIVVPTKEPKGERKISKRPFQNVDFDGRGVALRQNNTSLGFLGVTYLRYTSDVGILDQFGDPIHPLYHTAIVYKPYPQDSPGRKWIVGHEKFAQIAGVGMGPQLALMSVPRRRAGGGDLLLQNGWIRLTNEVSFVRLVEPGGVRLADNIQIMSPTMRAIGELSPNGVALTAAQEQALQRWVNDLFEKFFASPPQTTVFAEVSMEAMRRALDGSAKHTIAVWGHVLGEGKTRSLKSVQQDPRDKANPKFDFTDK